MLSLWEIRQNLFKSSRVPGLFEAESLNLQGAGGLGGLGGLKALQLRVRRF